MTNIWTTYELQRDARVAEGQKLLDPAKQLRAEMTAIAKPRRNNKRPTDVLQGKTRTQPRRSLASVDSCNDRETSAQSLPVDPRPLPT